MLRFVQAANRYTTQAVSNFGVARQLRNLFIQTAPTPNPDSQKYYSYDLTFMEEGESYELPAGQAHNSPLGSAIFEIDGVKGLYLGDDYITVTRTPGKDWQTINPSVYAAITSWSNSGAPLLHSKVESNEDTIPLDTDSEVVVAVKELVDAKIRPMLKRDGGNMRYIEYDHDEGTVYLLLEGACSNCPSSSNTLKHGIERMLMHWIPEITEVREVQQEEVEPLKLYMQEKRDKAEQAEAQQ